VAPFQLRFSLSRRQRLANELLPWVPALAGSLGFAIGIAYLAVEVSVWFLVLLVVPVILYRGFFTILFDLIIHSGQWVEMSVDDSRLDMQAGSKKTSLPLKGIIQVYRAVKVWTILHFDGSVVTIPADAIADEQIDFLKSFARIAAAERKAAQLDHSK
jgi:hypothetical protein